MRSTNPFDESSSDESQALETRSNDSPFSESSDDDDTLCYEDCNQDDSSDDDLSYDVDNSDDNSDDNDVKPLESSNHTQEVYNDNRWVNVGRVFNLSSKVSKNNSENIITNNVDSPEDIEAVKAGSIQNDPKTGAKKDHEEPSQKSGSKRVAPLSFDILPVIAKPALSFGSILRPRSDFVSPLETAMINKVDHLKSSHRSGDDDDDENNNNGGINGGNGSTDDEEIPQIVGGYFSYNWISNMSTNVTSLFQSPVKQSTSDSTRDKYENHHKGRQTQTGTVHDSKQNQEMSINKECILSPLAEAKDVLRRMDTITKVIKNGMPQSATKKKKSKQSRKLLEKSEEDKRVLKRIESHPNSAMTDQPWHRMILLEELGTASSWIVLLLPYVVFLVALLLDGDVDFWQTSSGPMSTRKICNSESNSTWDSIHSPSLANVQDRYSFPITPLPSTSCSYKYQIGVEEFSSDLWTNKITIDKEYKDYMSLGVAFTSGPLRDVPVLSSFLYGDLTYESLSSESVSLVADGLVEYSTVVMQQQLGDDPAGDDKWLPVSFSKPNKLSMICERGRKSSRAPFGTNKGAGREDTTGWKCQSPRNVDVLFYLMDSSFLTGGSLRVDTIISHSEHPRNATIQDIPYATNMTVALPSTKSTFYSDHIEDLDSVSHADYSNPDALIAEIAQSVSYTFTHSSQLRTQVLISVRIACLLLSISFLVFWFWSMGVDGFFVCGCWPSFLRDEQKYNSEEESILKTRKAEKFWWECPWILFPERRYLLLLVISLILIQNPVLTYMYFHPILNSSAKMHFIADSIIGIGFHSFLCLWLCLCQGLRYHTAKSARQRADHQKEVLELRRAAMYLSSANQESMYNSYGSTTDHVASYYEEFGDIHGSWKSLRLKHDPCGDGWADFLLPKMALLLLGASAAILSSALRFSCDFGKSYKWSTIAATKELPDTFVVASLFQVAILSLWCILIIRAAVRTGHLLKKESFLSTRPAQLAYRILMGILILGIFSVLIPLIIDISHMVKKWKILQGIGDYRTVEGASGLVYSSSSDYYIGKINRSTTDIMLNIALHAYQRFPYSGSAASLGPGEIIYITACTLVIAFIFLPSTTYMFILENSNNDADALAERGELHQTPKENQRRDKRDFLTLSRYTHTWRVFPLPIERHRHVKIAKGKPKTVGGFQLNKDFNTLPEKLGRGTIYEKNYIPLYCIETALWLLECSWQTYYSTTEYKTDGFAPGIMNLDALGLDLEADIYNESSDTRVFVASNIAPQVDGEADSMIVVAFRGTASTTNIKTDLNTDQQALPKYFKQDRPDYQIHLSNSYDLETEDGENCARVVKKEDESGTSFRQEANALLRSAPITRQVFPCVHSGFLEAYNLIKDDVIDAVVKVMKRQITKSLRRCSESKQYLPLVLPKIYVTGHSLGGALGQLLALDISCNIEIRIGGEPVLQKPKHVRGLSTPSIKKTFSADASSPMKPVLVRRNSFPSRSKTANSDTGDVDFIHGMLSGISFAGAKIKPRSIRPPIAVYTFGQPRVGNRAFARLYKAHVPHTFRVVAEGDAITVLPLATIRSGLAFYKHAGLDVILDEGSTGNILIGPTVVETLFRFSKVRTKLSNHLLDVYRNGLQSALTSEEVQEFYRTHGVNSRSIRSGYNVADVIPDWVTHFNRR